MFAWFKVQWRKIVSIINRIRHSKPITQVQSDDVKPQETVEYNYKQREWLKTNILGITIITISEGFYAEPYLCPANVPTIGYGTIRYPDGTPVKLSDPPCTKEQAREWFRSELKDKEDYLNRWLDKEGIVLNENQFSALLSFGYNVGMGRVTKGTIADALKKGDHKLVVETMLKYVKARNRWGFLSKLKGLEIRRKKEVALYNKPVKEE